MRPHRWQPTRLPSPWDSPARTLEWVAISFSNAGKWKVKVKPLSHVRLLATPWTTAYQALHPWDFPGKSTGVECHCLLRDIVCFVVITFGNIVIFSYDLEMFFFHVYIFYIFLKKRCFLWSYFFPFFSLKFFRTDIQGNVDIGDLTWEQKEKVLRLLFAKMNGFVPR